MIMVAEIVAASVLAVAVTWVLGAACLRGFVQIALRNKS